MKRMDGFNTLWLPGTDHAGIATQRGPGAPARRRGQDPPRPRPRGVPRARRGSGRRSRAAPSSASSSGSAPPATGRASASRWTPGLSRAVREVVRAPLRRGADLPRRLHRQLVPALPDGALRPRGRARGARRRVRLHQVRAAHPRHRAARRRCSATPASPCTPTTSATRSTSGKTLRRSRRCRATIDIQVVADEAVDPEFGTGVIKVTPGHDPVDFEIGQRHGLPVRTVIGFDGKMTAAAGKYAGLDRFEAASGSSRTCRRSGSSTSIEPYRHAVGLCYRCKTVVEPLVSKQWFVQRQAAGRRGDRRPCATDGSRIVPARLERRPTTTGWRTSGRGASRASSGGATASRPGTATPTARCTSRAPTSRACPKCGGPVRQDPDVLDTWFSSGLWPFSTLGWPDDTPELRTFYPTSVLVTGYDIIFFWVARMVMFGPALHERRARSATSTSTRSCATPRARRCRSRRATSSTRSTSWSKYGTDALRFTLAALAAQGARHPHRRRARRGLPQLRQQALERLAPRALEPRRLRPGAATAAPAGLPDRWIESRLHGDRSRDVRERARRLPLQRRRRRRSTSSSGTSSATGTSRSPSPRSTAPTSPAERSASQHTLVDRARDDAAAAPPVHAVHHRGDLAAAAARGRVDHDRAVPDGRRAAGPTPTPSARWRC